MSQKSLFAAILCAAVSLANASEELPPLEILLVTGTRTEQPLKQSLSHATVITQQDIQDSQAADVPSVLRNLAGIELYQSGGTGKQSSLFMRGTNSSHVLVLLDGVRIGSATTGTTAVDQLMLDQIERIEVVRGNVSSLYGSEAIGGVIQIFTRRGKGVPRFNASGAAGSHNTRRLNAGFGGETGMAAFNVQVSKYKTDGISAINSAIVPTVNPDKDGYDNTSLSANARYALHADHSLSGSVFRSRGRVQFDDAFALPADVNSSTSELGKYALILEDQLGNMWQSMLRLAQGSDKLTTWLNGLPDPFGGYVKTKNRQFTWQNRLVFNPGNDVLLGIEKLKQLVESDTAYASTGRVVDSFFSGYTGKLGSHQLQINLRHDHYSDFGTANTGLLGYGHIINPAWRLSASASSAFKAPGFTELYGPAFWGSNPDLKPERARNRELGVHFADGAQHLDAAYFDNRIRDLIAGFPSQNVNQARINGVEIGYGNQLGRTALVAALTWQNPRDTATGNTLLRRARKYGNIAALRDMGEWTMGVEAQFSGTREDGDINTFARVTLPGYAVVNMTAKRSISKHFKLLLRADNLLNKDYMLAHGYNTLGRTLLVSLSYQQ